MPFNAPQDAPVSYLLDLTGALDGSGVRRVTVPAADQYRLQMEAFSRAMRGEQPDAAGLEDAIVNMRVIEALFASAGSGRAERP